MQENRTRDDGPATIALYAMFPWLWPQGAYMYPWGSRAALRHYGITV